MHVGAVCCKSICAKGAVLGQPADNILVQICRAHGTRAQPRVRNKAIGFVSRLGSKSCFGHASLAAEDLSPVAAEACELIQPYLTFPWRRKKFQALKARPRFRPRALVRIQPLPPIAATDEVRRFLRTARSCIHRDPAKILRALLSVVCSELSEIRLMTADDRNLLSRHI